MINSQPIPQAPSHFSFPKILFCHNIQVINIRNRIDMYGSSPSNMYHSRSILFEDIILECDYDIRDQRQLIIKYG